MATIVVIDDDPGCRAALERVLKLEGHEVHVATEGESGIALCRNVSPDLVFTDLFMPGKEGMETIRELRRECPTLPIVAVSGSLHRHTDDLLKVARYLGARASLRKPFSAEEVHRVVQETLGSSS